ncbi:MAG: S-layer homology domain-containing protein [Oscillibacter sp.]|nr:S-layer homology domain-containing protein [Oscillibacter sp.]
MREFHRINGRHALALLTLLLCLLLLPVRARAESVYDDAMSKLVAWGVIQGYQDGETHPERMVTRAQFVAMVNRAYGYSQKGEHPFRDILPSSWYYDDVVIAYTARYFTGTDRYNASPDRLLTRQQAMTMLAKNLRLTPVPGEVTQFTDGNAFADYSKGYVKAAVQKGLIKGYPDGSFRPEANISRGAMALLLERALGNLIQEPGVYELDDVFGNVTISSSATTLRNTTIAGNLYISGGLELSGVTLENVRVLGDIIVAGSGESETGDESVVLRNVEANNLEVDSLKGQYLSLRSEGTTSIQNTSIRSGAYLQDRTPTGRGLLNITLEGPAESNFSLSGNLENVVNKTPGSTLRVAAGTLQSLTIDEQAAGSSLILDPNATVKTLNLDTGVPVTGNGDVETVNINTTGSIISMLPDNIVIRPGITALVSGTRMDATQATEASEDPRLLAGYPRVSNIAPTSAAAWFSANKTGIVYWAVSGLPDGSINEEELMNPASYGSKSISNGSTEIKESHQEVRVNVPRLTAGGSYYLSAIMVDARGTRSPVKVISFSTPDGTVPAFTAGYPNISSNTYDRNSASVDRYSAQVMVMANKTCMLYWALYNTGSATPAGRDFRAGSLGGAIASGILDLTRSLPSLVQLTGLHEQTKYDVYLWLTDADFAQSSPVRKLTFTTVDGTPPEFRTPLTVNQVRATSIRFTCMLNEQGTVYWVAVRSGTDYPLPPAGSSIVTPEYAQLQISSGMNGVKSGSVTARPNTLAQINITGLQTETSYDIWYIAKDLAGNYSVYPTGDPNNPTDPNNPKRTCMVTANTLDNAPPIASQEFTRTPENSPNSPYADSDIRVIFNESIQQASTNLRFIDLYQDVLLAQSSADRATAKDNLAEALRACVKLYDRTNPGLPVLVNERNSANASTITNWVVDYRNCTVSMEDARTVITFPTYIETDDRQTSALRLSSGTSYYFQIEDISDTSSAQNRMATVRLERFRTIASQVALTNLSLAAEAYPIGISDIDMSFAVTPISTSMADPTTTWDMLIWSDISCEYEMYVRSRLSDSLSYDISTDTDANGWRRIQNPKDASGGTGKVAIPSTMKNQRVGQSLHFNLYNYGVGETPNLTKLSDGSVYEYAIRFREINGDNQRTGWSQEVHFYISVISGSSNELGNLASNVTEERFTTAKQEETINELSTPPDLGFRLTKAFLDTVAPTFSSGRPIFTPLDISVEMRLQISRQGTVFYALAPADDTISTRDLDGLSVNWFRKDEIPTTGSDVRLDSTGNEVRDENGDPIPLAPFYVSTPSYLEIVNPEYDNPEIITGYVPITSGTVTATVDGLLPETNYFAYFVIRGTGQTYSQYAQIFRFTTLEVQRPVLTLDLANPIVNVSTDKRSTVDFMIVNYNSAALSNLLSRAFWNNDPTGDADPPENFPNYAGISSVLQALATNLASSDSNGEGCVFDKYATQNFKDQLAEYIRASSSNTAGTIIGVGHGIEVNSGQRYVVDASEYPMSERAQYAFLAVGRSTSGSGDAFRCIYPLTLVDSEAPIVTAIQNTLNMDIIDGRVGNTCSGRISLTFNEYLYHSDDSTSPPTLRQVDRGPIISSLREQPEYENFRAVASLMQTRSSTQISLMEDDETQIGKQTLTIEFQLDHAENGTFLTFSSDLCDQYSNVRGSPLTVSIRIVQLKTQVDVDDKGDPIYGFISTPLIELTPAWDGTSFESR